MKKIMSSTIALPIVISLILIIASGLTGYYSAQAGVKNAIAQIRESQAVTEVRVANLETNFNKHTIEQNETFRQILEAIKTTGVDYKELTKVLYDLKVQIANR